MPESNFSSSFDETAQEAVSNLFAGTNYADKKAEGTTGYVYMARLLGYAVASGGVTSSVMTQQQYNQMLLDVLSWVDQAGWEE